jgi:hypothetical protein
MTPAERQKRRREKLADEWNQTPGRWVERIVEIQNRLWEMAGVMKAHGLNVDELRELSERLEDIEATAYDAIYGED